MTAALASLRSFRRTNVQPTPRRIRAARCHLGPWPMATPDALPPQRGAGEGYKVKEVEDPLFSRSQGNTRRPAAGRSGIVTGPNRCARP